MDTETSKLVEQSRSLLEALNKFEAPKKPKEEKPPEEEPLVLPKISFIPEILWPTRADTFKKNALGFIESFYEENSKLPNKNDFRKVFSPAELPSSKEAWEEFIIEIQEPLIARGIRPYELPQSFYEAQFVLACNLICDPLDKRAINAKLKEAGITTKQWKNFLNEEKYLSYYRKCVDKIFSNQTQITAQRNLTQLVENGDLQAIKYYEERQNIYRPQREQNYTEVLLSMITAMMEILAKHVTPDVLNKVALEFQEREIIDVTPSLPVGN